MTKHALLSPSGFKALMICPAKPAMELGLPDTESEYSKEGTRAHELAAWALATGEPLGDFAGAFRPDVEMIEAVQVYVDLVRDVGKDVPMLWVEQEVPIDHITGEVGATGTADAIIYDPETGELTVIDLKYGRGVEVSAVGNPQLMLYALGAMKLHGITPKHVTVIISQPRVSHTASFDSISADALVEWGYGTAQDAARKAMIHLESYNQYGISPSEFCNPHEDACRFCKAKATCPALAATVSTALGAEFTDLTTADKVEQEQIVRRSVGDVSGLGAKMDAVPLVELWCKAIRAKVESALLDGQPIEGYKLVAGRKGARAWLDADEAEKALKAMRLKKDEMYDLKLISPTTAEKVLGAQPKRWAKVQALIGQGEGKPSVAPVQDKRPALQVKPLESEFEAIPAQAVDDLI